MDQTYWKNQNLLVLNITIISKKLNESYSTCEVSDNDHGLFLNNVQGSLIEWHHLPFSYMHELIFSTCEVIEMNTLRIKHSNNLCWCWFRMPQFIFDHVVAREAYVFFEKSIYRILLNKPLLLGSLHYVELIFTSF